MADENKRTVGIDEIIEFGNYLNGLHDTDRTFERPDVSRRMKSCSLDEVIIGFQAFFNRKTDSFKVRITFPGGLTHSTTEFSRRGSDHGR